MHRIQRAFTFKMMYRNLGTSGGATNSLNRALIRSHHTDYKAKIIRCDGAAQGEGAVFGEEKLS